MRSSLFGLNVVVSPDRPRYELPAEVMPGVPWPPGFREDINTWSWSFLGTTNNVPRGMSYVIGGHTLVLRPEDAARVSILREVT